MSRRIARTYDIVTPESAVEGEFEESGWVDPDGMEIEPDEFELEEGITAVDLAVRYLKDEGACHASSSVFHAGIWYSTEPSQDFRDGSYTTYHFHLRGFTAEEGKEIFNRITEKR